MASKVAKFKTKAMVLGILVFQNSALALMMRYTRKSSNSEKVYAATTAVFTSEVIKFLVSVAVFSKDQKCGLFRGLAYLQDFIVSRPLELLKIAVPSGLYTVQNYLQYLAVSNLDGPTFQLLSQLKILTTAAFAVALLGKKLMKAQWVSLLLLVCGVGLVQLSVQARASAAASPDPAGGGATALLPRAAVVVVRVPAAGVLFLFLL
uniref:Uncharacterized protein n=1 Tax=Heterosigma akashiwo TaxID=2829 RepID=A0A6V1U6W2_HETAK